MDLNLHLIRAVAGDRAVDFRAAAGNQPRDATATSRAHDVRQIDVTPHGCAADDDFALALKRRGRLVPQMFKVRSAEFGVRSIRHGSIPYHSAFLHSALRIFNSSASADDSR